MNASPRTELSVTQVIILGLGVITGLITSIILIWV
jgi:hypothetical protein